MDFDGFKDGVLLEIKGPGYRELLQKMYGRKGFTGAKEMLVQARNQSSAAGQTPIQWHFAESEVADSMRGEFKSEELDHIQVIHTPVSP